MRFLKIVFDWAETFDFSTLSRMLSQRWNHFLICFASDEMHSLYAQPAMKFVPRMLRIFWMMFLSIRKNWLLVCPACVEIGYSLAEHARKLVTLWLSIRKNWLLVGWACMEIGYSLAERVRKLVTLWLSIRGNSLLIGYPPVSCPTSHVSLDSWENIL